MDKDIQRRSLACLKLSALLRMNGPVRQAVDGLGGIGQGNPDAIARLLEIIRTTEDE
ncbi:hypothetical protein AP9108_26765 [Arthrospira sp. PCC 9108]|nr:hypothetical protein AP9108_26765 [Arthrospira sp. PCC 9108]